MLVMGLSLACFAETGRSPVKEGETGNVRGTSHTTGCVIETRGKTGTTITETKTGLGIGTGRRKEIVGMIVTVVAAETGKETVAVIVIGIMNGIVIVIALVIGNENVTEIMTVLATKGIIVDTHMREMVTMTKLSQCMFENGPAPKIGILSLVNMNMEETGLMNLLSVGMAMSMIIIIMASNMITSSHMVASLSMKSGE